MQKRQILLIFLTTLTTIYSCKTYKPITGQSGYNPPPSDYINRYKDLAVSEMRRTGVPASITLAQGIIESDWGRSRIAREANNHFGIKCHNGWAGLTISHTDNARDECFRKYSRPEDSFYDHSDFLRNTSRYKDLFSLPVTDYKAWAHGLRKAGYATNPQYAGMLIRTIEENSLWSFDQGQTNIQPDVRNTPPVNYGDSSRKQQVIEQVPSVVVARVPRIAENNRIQYIIVKPGETKEKIEDEFQLLKWELSKYNDLSIDFVPVPGQILYLQPKRDKAEAGKDFYTAVDGDSMYVISQKFGIKLKSLYQMNRMEEGTEPQAGSKIWLRKVKPL
jgi:LysM repeat protein